VCYQPSQRRTKGLAGLPVLSVFLATSVLGWSGIATAQQNPDAGLNEVSRIVVSGVDEGPLRQAVRRAGERLAQSSAPVLPAGAQDQSWIARHPVIVGTLIGTGAGLALSQVDALGGATTIPALH
jgi:hypothetical protein